jgi:gluconolactonase
MYVFAPPVRVETEVYFRLPEKFRRKQRTPWSDPNRLGEAVDSFLEGPSFDRDGNLYFVDIPFGRVFRLSPTRDCELVAQYDGWPNGLKIHQDGRIFICDYRRGLLELDPRRGTVEPILATRHSESFKGLNDLVFARNGDCYFTDQGQTGMHDPSGRVFRLAASGRLDCFMDNVPSPNGIALNHAENRLFVAATRQNAVWRAPLMVDGSVSKVGTYLQLSGGHAGPDGLAVDREDGLCVCHLGIGIWRFDGNGIPTHLVTACVGRHMTNLAFGGPENRHLYITESDTGSILRAEMPVPGKPMYSQYSHHA